MNAPRYGTDPRVACTEIPEWVPASLVQKSAERGPLSAATLALAACLSACSVCGHVGEGIVCDLHGEGDAE